MEKIELVKTPECLIHFDKNPIFSVPEGPSDSTQQVITSNGFSTQQLNFSYNPPSFRTVVDRAMILRVAFRLTFSGSGTGDLLQIGSNDALRAFPLSKCIQSVKLEIDNGSSSIQTRDLIYGMERYISDECLENDLGSSLGFLDQYQSYVDYQQYGSAKNALGNYGEQGMAGPTGRGGYSRINVVSNNNTSAVVDVVLTEPLWVSPTSYKSDCKKGLVMMNQMNLTVQFADLSNLFSHAVSKGGFTGGNTIDSIDVTINTGSGYPSPSLLITQGELPSTVELPKTVLYNYSNVRVYTDSQSASVASGGSASVNSKNIQVGSTPKYLMVYLRKSRNSANFNDADTFARIDSFNLQYGSRNGLFSNATSEQLFEIASSNGLKGDYNAWNKYTGSCLLLEFGKDIPLQADDCPGRLGQNQFQINLTYTNLNEYDTITFDLYTIVVEAGVMVKTPGNSVFMNGMFSAEDVLKARGMDRQMGGEVIGGSLMDRVKTGIRKALPFVKTGMEVGKTLAPLLPLLLAAGFTETEAKEILEQKKMKGGKTVGRAKLLEKISKY